MKKKKNIIAILPSSCCKADGHIDDMVEKMKQNLATSANYGLTSFPPTAGDFLYHISYHITYHYAEWSNFTNPQFSLGVS